MVPHYYGNRRRCKRLNNRYTKVTKLNQKEVIEWRI
ncbi:hypothetical protein MUDAN_BIHEEGNE_01879 [Lactiplantibacillus mudanjiangensis]|uniref:Uncharacterized protein n=1 Tax=Lactiplantibacillus mudanjiangensis TaxID=1296538 RepID=A0A660E4A9_9LACO|nr:hypothetical protein MUDAN_BIHEEGNE_01879 [Lactiplantibacillus mudanjiangensis]VDG24048.1 hypothetical protein MUDAN_IGPPGNFN_00665 [Lactiplantibacillus mudanjiangensis]VDG30228.1 hypothetical protein MUDAN_MDHGFNIF_01779 [Lactiplantibacillus mudanjiangensis]VDG33854.1 hypothetical protein MUDAN_DOGOELCO_02989 [Lactiplantibacillus mudanjiangensis]